MHKAIFFLIFIFTSCMGFSQSGAIKMISEYGTKDQELSNVLDFQNIDYYNVKFIGAGLKHKFFSLIVKEMWDGRLTKLDTIINSKSNNKIGKINHDTLLLTTIGARIDNRLKLFFRFPVVWLTRKYDATISDDYS